MLILHLCGIFAIVIPLWVTAPRAPAHTALLDFVNNGNWPTKVPTGSSPSSSMSLIVLNLGTVGDDWIGNSTECFDWIRLLCAYV